MCDGVLNVGGNPEGNNSSRARNAALGNDVNCCIKATYNTPMDMKSSYDSSTKSVKINLPSGGTMSFKGSDGSATADRSGVSRKDSSLAQYLNADMTPCTTGNASFVKVVQPDGSSQTLNLSSGSVHSMTTPTGAVVSKQTYDSQVQVSKNPQGDVTRITSSRDGILDLSRTSNKLTISQYSTSQVSRNARGEAVPQGDPVKVYSYEWDASTQTMTIINQEKGLQAFTKTRRIEGNKTIITEGSGDERIVTIYERNFLPGEKWEEIKTVQGFKEITPSSCERVVKKYTDGGWLVLSRTEGYGTALARTTSYTYNSQFRVSVKALPDGGYTRYEYDTQGRVIMEASPWTDGDYEKVVRTTYADLRFNDCRPALEQVSLMHVSTGEETEIKSTTYSYEDSPQLSRTITSVLAVGATTPLVTIKDIWGENAANEYSRGRVKMEQDASGVQKCTSYEDTTLYGAKWKVTMETRVNDAVIPGQSEKTIRYLAEDETIAREEKYVHTGQGWSLVSSEDYQYDALKRLIKTTRGNGRISTAEWGCCGPLRRVDEDGVMLTFGYNSARQLVEVIRSATGTMPEAITTYVRNSSGQILQVREDRGAMSRSRSFAYDILGRIVSETNALGKTTSYSYGNYGLRKTTTLPTGAQEITEKNKDGSLHYQSISGKRPSTYVYAPTGNYCRITLKYENSIIPAYAETDWNDRLLSIYMASISEPSNYFKIASNEYNSSNQIVKSTERGVLTQYEYGPFGNVICMTIPLEDFPTVLNSKIENYSSTYESREDGIYHLLTKTSYNASGQPITLSRADLISELDSQLENKTIHTNIYGNSSTEWTEYDGPTKRKQQKTFPSSNITAETHITDNFIIYRKNPDGEEMAYTRTYTSTGSIETATDARGITKTVKYDTAERIVLTTDGAGNSTATTYDDNTGEISLVTDALGKTTCYKYDEHGRMTAIYGTGAHPVCYGYDMDSNLISMTTFRVPSGTITNDPTGRLDGDTTEWEYSCQGNLPLKKTYPDGSGIQMEYDEMNRLARITNARGMSIVQTYDPKTGWIVSISCSDSMTPDVSYAYNHLGWLTRITDGTGIREINYTTYGFIGTESTLVNNTPYLLCNTYDSLGRLSGYDLTAGNSAIHILTALQTYRGDGRLDYAGVKVNGTLNSFSYQYLAGTNLVQKITMPGGWEQSLTYDPNRNLLSKMDVVKGSLSKIVRTYDYDQVYRLTSQSQKRGDAPFDPCSFSYNERSELSSATLGTSLFQYAYDNFGNRKIALEEGVSSPYTSNALDQYTLIGTAPSGFVPEYDSDGNQTRIQTATGIWNVVYDAQNRPVRFNSSNGSTIIECGYDANSRRFVKKVTQNGTITKHERYLYRGYNQIAALNLLNGAAPLYALLWEPLESKNSRPLALVKGGSVYACIQDQNANVTELMNANGEMVGMYDYAPFGSVSEQGTVSCPVQWSSEMYDEELGLVYYNYRYYNPLEGRWLSRDLASADNYVFCHNAPTVFFDYLGNVAAPARLGEPPPLSDMPDFDNPSPPKPTEPRKPGIPGMPNSGIPGPRNPQGNCASESLDRKSKFNPTFNGDDLPPEFGQNGEGCRKVKDGSECKKENPDKERHVLYAYDINGLDDKDKDGNPYPGYHVIGEDCLNNPGTYKSQLGSGGTKVSGITDPVAAMQEYFDHIPPLPDHKKPVPKIIHMCCPCKKEE